MHKASHSTQLCTIVVICCVSEQADSAQEPAAAVVGAAHLLAALACTVRYTTRIYITNVEHYKYKSSIRC
jgi:hypothetical protein